MPVCVPQFVGSLRAAFGSLFGIALLTVLGAVLTGVSLGYIVSRQPVKPAKVAANTHTAVLQDSDWLSESYWRRRKQRKLRSRQFSNPSQLGANPFISAFERPAPIRQSRTSSGNYRTVCVRLCDGYYFPISFSTTSSRFGADEQACKSKCSSDARLYVYNNANGSPETMKDRRGRAYSDLNTAFLYRTAYKKSCQCRAEPWSTESKQRHAMYRTKAWQRRAKRLARLEERRARRAIRAARLTKRLHQPIATVIQPADQSESLGVVAVEPVKVSRVVIPPRRQTRMRLGGPEQATVRRRSSRPPPVRRRRSWRARAFTTEN